MSTVFELSTADSPVISKPMMEMFKLLLEDGCNEVELIRLINEIPGLADTIVDAEKSKYSRDSTNSVKLSNAVRSLGSAETLRIAFSNSLASSATVLDQKTLDEIRLKSIIQSLTMTRLAQFRIHINECEAAATGLLMDIGMILFLRYYREKYAGSVRQSKLNRCPIEQAENQKFEITHAELGAVYLKANKLPVCLVDAVMHHNCSAEKILELVSIKNNELISFSAIASHIADFFVQNTQALSVRMSSSIAGPMLGLEPEETEWILHAVFQDLHQFGRFYGLALEALPSLETLLGRTAAQFALQKTVVQEAWTSYGPPNDCVKTQNHFRSVLSLSNYTHCIDGETLALKHDYFMGRLDENIRHSKLSNRPIGLIAVDIDNMDELHVDGGTSVDRARYIVSRFLRDVAGESVPVASWSTSKFYLVMNNTTVDGLKEFTTHLCDSSRNINWCNLVLEPPFKLRIAAVTQRPKYSEDLLSGQQWVDAVNNTMNDSRKWNKLKPVIRMIADTRPMKNPSSPGMINDSPEEMLDKKRLAIL